MEPPFFERTTALKTIFIMWKLGLTFSDPQIFEHENLTEDFEGVYEGDESYKLESTTLSKDKKTFVEFKVLSFLKIFMP